MNDTGFYTSLTIALLIAAPLAFFMSRQLGIMFTRAPFSFAWSWIGAGQWFLLIMVLSILASLVPAWNAARLIFPAEVPGTGARLLPWYEFDRTELQAELLDRLYLHGAKFGPLARSERVRWMIATADLGTGDGVGILANGLLRRPMPRS